MKKIIFNMKKVAIAASLLSISANVFGVENAEWFEAARTNNLKEINQIIKQGVDLNVKDENENTALIIASQEGHIDVINRLISPGNDEALNLILRWNDSKRQNGGKRKISQKDVHQWMQGWRTVDLNAKDKKGRTALIWAAMKGHYEVARLLVYAGANVNITDSVSSMQTYRDGGMSALMWAAYGHSDITRLLIDAGADVNVIDVNAGTPLLRAVQGQRSDIAKWLIDAGADVNVICRVRKRSVLIEAIEKGCLNLARWLIKAGADVNAIDRSRTSLNYAFKEGDFDLVRLLINAGADVNLGDPVLIQAIEKGQINLVKLLIKAGADVNARDQDGDIALNYAIKRGREMTRLLIDAGADVNMEGRYYTPLIKAIEERSYDVVRLLIKAGADVNLKNNDGSFPLSKAAASKNEGMVELLLNSGVDISKQGSDALWLETED